MSDSFIMIAGYSASYEANSALSRLQAAGIPAFLTGEMTASTFSGNYGMGPNIQLLVARSDAKRAADIIGCLEEERMEAGWEDDFSTEEGYWICSQCDEAIEDASDICPWCKSPREERDAFDSP